MSGCQCYQIGGPFIAEDPDCPAHGLEAQRLEREREERETAEGEKFAALLARVEALERKCSNLDDEVRYLRRMTGTAPRGMPR